MDIDERARVIGVEFDAGGLDYTAVIEWQRREIDRLRGQLRASENAALKIAEQCDLPRLCALLIGMAIGVVGLIWLALHMAGGGGGGW